MWLSSKLNDLLDLNVQEVKRLREELAGTKAERDLLRTQLTIAQTNFNWARLRLNSLEYEKSALLQKSFGINLPAPEIVRTERDLSTGSFQLADLFAGPPLDAYDTPED